MNSALKERIELANAKKYLSILDVSLISGFSISSLRRRLKDKVIKAYQEKAKGKLIFKKDDIEKWIENGAR